MADKVLVKDLVEALKLKVEIGEDFLDNEIKRDVLSRPGVEIYSGYFELYEHTRIQVVGTKEINLFYNSLISFSSSILTLLSFNASIAFSIFSVVDLS